jgi:trans-aconitate 2-methyltransferase
MADWDGQAYRQVSDLQQWLAREALAGLSFTRRERVLDVGCGDGRITAAIARQLSAGSVLGIDPSPRMVEAARGVASARARFEIGDVVGMRFRDEFDAVVSFNALHWVADQRGALHRIRKALHDTGWALIQQVCQGQRPSLEATAMQVCHEPAWRGYFAGFEAPFTHVDPSTYPTTAADAGLDVEQCTVADLHWDFDDPAAFARWCRVGFDAWNARLPDDATVDAFVADVAAAYAQVTGSPQRFQFLQMRARLRPTTASRADQGTR